MIVTRSLDLTQTVPFLEALAQKPGQGMDVPFTWQTFDDLKTRKQNNLAGVKHGALQHRLQELEALQSRGAGVFVTVNETNLQGRKRSSIYQVRAVWCDLDAKDRAPGVEIDLQQLALPPTIVTRSGHGMHLYWLLAVPSRELDRAEALLKSIAFHLKDWGADANATDLARVLRLPGTLNLKDPENPVLVTLLAPPDLRLVYDLDDLEAAFPAPEMALPALQTGKPIIWSTQLDGGNKLEQARRYFQRVPGAVQTKNGDPATFRAACKAVRGFDLSDDEALQVLSEWNQTCSPPWDQADLVAKIRGAREYGTGPFGLLLRDPAAPPPSRKKIPAGDLFPGQSVDVDDAALSRLRRDEIALGERFIARYGHRFRYFPARASWLAWDGKRWKLDNQVAERFALLTLRDLLAEADTIPDLDERSDFLKFAAASQKGFKAETILKMARSHPDLVVYPDQLDADPWLMNVNNGVLDLRTGQLAIHDPKLLLTKLAPVDYIPDAICPTWSRFVSSVMWGDAELVEFLQRALGYTLTADVSEQVLLFLHGNGSNGKSTMLETLRRIMGDYAVSVPESLLLGEDVHSTDVLQLMGARLAEAHEVRRGSRWNEASLKRVTGGDTLRGRALYSSQHLEFRPTHKVLVSANHKPDVDDLSYAFWRRMRLVPFTQRYVGPDEPGYDQVAADRRKDPLMGEALRGELSGILTWLVRGCIAWQQARKEDAANGLGYPAKMRQAVEQYRSDQDPVGRFLEDRCVFLKEAKVKGSALVDAYEAWAKENGEGKGISGRAMTQAINAKVESMEFQLRYGFDPTYKRTASWRGWEGIGLQAKDTED